MGPAEFAGPIFFALIRTKNTPYSEDPTTGGNMKKFIISVVVLVAGGFGAYKLLGQKNEETNDGVFVL